MKVLRGAALVAALALFASTIEAARAAEPYEIPVILSLSGQAAFIGNGQVAALKILEGVENKAGGIGGRPIHFTIVDDQSSPSVAVQLANSYIAKNPPVILGPSLTATCAAVYAIVKDNGPIEYCFSPALHPAAQSYGFSGGASTLDIALGGLRYFRDRGWKRLALISSTDASGQDGENVVKANLQTPEFKDVQLVDNEHFAVGDVSVAAQVAKIKASNPDAVIDWTTGPPTGTVLRGLHDAGVDLPTLVNAGNIVAAQLTQYASFVPSELYLPGFRFLGRDLPALGTVKAQQKILYDAFTAAGTRPEVNQSFAWDPARVVIDALRHVGPNPTPARVKAYIEALYDYPGINGLMDYRNGNQRGLTSDAIVVIRWYPEKQVFLTVSGPGGTPR
jgi:branched-chain amino acid transport system substrate-binding protein